MIRQFTLLIIIISLVGCAGREDKFFTIVIEKSGNGYGFRCNDKELVDEIARDQDSDFSKHSLLKKYELVYQCEESNGRFTFAEGLEIVPRTDGKCYLKINQTIYVIGDADVGRAIIYRRK